VAQRRNRTSQVALFPSLMRLDAVMKLREAMMESILVTASSQQPAERQGKANPVEMGLLGLLKRRIKKETSTSSQLLFGAAAAPV